VGFVYLLHKSEPKAVPPPDRDKDGTSDALDKCPDQPGPASALGCPDTDKDGLGDHEDGCPNDGGPLETQGCPDTDGDGFPDKDDECPTTAGRWNGCPDTDFDGIPDKNDNCPTEAGPSSNGGCPEVVDSDGDGVPDKEDKCPTEKGIAANNGCPADTDGDGVADAVDKCPTTAGPASNFGCPEVKQEVKERLKFATKAVQFETAKATLKNQSFAVLDEIVEIMRQYPDYTLSVSGHTDNTGDEMKNLRLSEARAKTCYDYLLFRGIKAERLRYAGFGEERPIADNDTAEGREQNRRVDFELVLD
jgi:outer membrane protein OmpA-like peptidoglycan-associated protein